MSGFDRFDGALDDYMQRKKAEPPAPVVEAGFMPVPICDADGAVVDYGKTQKLVTIFTLRPGIKEVRYDPETGEYRYIKAD